MRVVTVGQLLQLTVGQVRTLEQRRPCVLWVLNSGTLQVPLRLTVVSLAPQRPALVLQQMTEMEIQVPENFPDEDDEELEDTEGDNVQTEHDDPDPGSASQETASPTFISRLASLFSSSDNRESRLKVVIHYQEY